MSDFRFADPQFAYALWAVLGLLALLFWLDRRGGSALEQLVGASLQQRLVQRPSSWRRSLRIVLLGLAAASAVLALMRPQWGLRVIASSRASAEIMVALDVSRSMLAEDVAPNRLERAKAEIVDLLSYLKGDQVGLIAFSGRASVLCPLTPDFGFLRLVLEGASPRSVTRGGTRLAEPIRKAVAGFGHSQGAARAILLITDGEDHDSFALDAAKEAAAAGVRIIAIGFGDERGSEIRVTDPRTGARRVLRDGDGQPVVSRLDGDLLRELALATGGAYVPAGTGVLDLESIYEEHIARLTRGEMDGQRTVRDEAYPWFVLLSLIFLVVGAAVSAGRVAIRGPAALAIAALAVGVATAPGATADDDSAEPIPTDAVLPPVPDAPGPETPGAAVGETQPEASVAQPPDVDPREIYNRGVAALEAREPDEAERLLERARRDARDDDRLRFHAAYNLGWVSVQQAGRIRAEAPRPALEKLHRAADWFRSAVRLRPDDEDARYNLEVTLRRALVLADELARNEGGLEGKLAELVARQRRLVASAASLLELTASDDPVGGHADEAMRREFRVRATAQRGVLSDADQLAERVGGERDALEARPEEERTPQDGMREVQLANVLGYLHRARERMGQARRQLRQRQPSRAFRRASAALTNLKRAQDELADPAAVLDRLLQDGGETARSTLHLWLSERALPGLDSQVPPAPRWLSVESLADGQGSLAERIEELHLRLLGGLEQGEAVDLDALPPEQAELLAAIRAAVPLVEAGHKSAAAAGSSLAAGVLNEVPLAQRASLESLAAARERFLDLRGLIEATYAAEQQLAGVLSAPGTEAAAARVEFLPSLRRGQDANLERGARLEQKLQAEVEKAALAAQQPPGDPSDPTADPGASEAERERFALATQVLTLALAAMDGARSSLSTPEPGADVAAAGVDWEAAQSDVASAVEHLETLRRLFFSIVQHVRELARRQVDLADRTQEATALSAQPDADPSARAAPLVEPERRLASDTLVIANALQEQSNATAGTAGEDPQAEEATRRLREAGEHVLYAQGAMEQSTGALEAPVDFAAAHTAQDEAVASLARALEILEPPSENQGGDSDQPQQQGPPEEQQQAEGDSGEQTESDQAAQQAMDPAQLLQEVRDREAQRRRDKANRPAGYETVEKDW